MSNVPIPVWVTPDFLQGGTPEEIYEIMKQTDIGNGRTIQDILSTEQGSMFYDLCYPNAIAKANLISNQLQLAIQACFPQYAFGDFLDMHGTMYGVERLEATPSEVVLLLTGGSGAVVPAGSIFRTSPDSDGLSRQFTTTSEVTLSSGVGTVTALSADTGSVQNVGPSTITNIISSITGIVSCTNPSAATGGSDDESDDSYRQRILDRTSSEPGAGSLADYERWAEAVSGIGSAKAIADWNSDYGTGYGAVKILLLGADNTPANTSVTEEVQGTIWPATPASVTLTITCSGTTTIPIGSLFKTSGTTPDGILFKTMELKGRTGAGDVDVLCEAVEPGPRGNVAIGTITAIEEAPAEATAVTNAAAATGGAATYDGLAPLGAVVTCKPFDAVGITYTARIVYDNTIISEAQIIEAWDNALQNYYDDAKDDGTNGIVRVNKVLGLLLGIDGVRDYNSFSMVAGGSTYTVTNIALDIDDYPVTDDIRFLWQVPILVKDITSGTPIAGATVMWGETGASVGTTDASGELTLYVESGTYVYTAQKSTYQNASIAVVVAGSDVLQSNSTIELLAI